MTGLVVAGAMGASLPEDVGGGDDDDSNDNDDEPEKKKRVKLYLVERSGTRGKAETKIRAAGEKRKRDGSGGGDCLRLDLVDVSRVKCDLAHVDMSSALPPEVRSTSSKVVVVAKHLCGAGTDLAIKSLVGIGASNVDGCVMATCCHGLCTWEEYVGRDCLLGLLRGEVGGMPSFGAREFNLMKRWTSASVLGGAPGDASKTGAPTDESEGRGEHGGSQYLPSNVVAVVKGLGLECGVRGLGRACQRLIDHGRAEYMRKNLFGGAADSVGMLHYVPRDVSPQNALLWASRS